jgi:hypothetical protein
LTGWHASYSPIYSPRRRRNDPGNDLKSVALTTWTENVTPRELIEPHGDKRYIRRGKKGQFTSRQVDVGRSLSADRRSKAKRIAKKGVGDRGDRRSD